MEEETYGQTGPDFVIEELVTYLSRSTFTDLLFLCGDGGVVKAHCAVLSASSAFIKQMVRETHHFQGLVTVCLPDYMSRDVLMLLELVYNGELAVYEDRERLMTLMKELEVTTDIQMHEIANPSHEYEAVSLEAEVEINVDGDEDEELENLQEEEIEQKYQPPIPIIVPSAAKKLIASNNSKTSTVISAETKAALDQKTREMLGYQPPGPGSSPDTHAQNRCRCIICMDPSTRGHLRGQNALHMCHYPDCGRQYKKTSHLRAHLRGHVGDQPYVCSWPRCGKRFTRSDELHRHFRIHTGEKNHKCSFCDKSFPGTLIEFNAVGNIKWALLY